MPFEKQAYIEFLLANNVVGLFPEGRKLKSGRVSHWYANCRALADTAANLNRLAAFVDEFVKSLDARFDYYYGVPEGGTKLGIACNLHRAQEEGCADQPVVMGRGRPKEHGDPKDSLFIGPVQEGDRAVVLEDVTTTGGSMLDALDGLLNAGVKIVAVVALLDRMELRDDGRSVAQKVAEQGITYHSLAAAEDVLPAYVREVSAPDELIRKLCEDFENYGVKPLELR